MGNNEVGWFHLIDSKSTQHQQYQLLNRSSDSFCSDDLNLSNNSKTSKKTNTLRTFKTALFIIFAIILYGQYVGWTPIHSRPLQPQELLQDRVSWDKHSLLIDGKRIMFMSGEFHPFRLPVPSLWLDVFQKMRSAGFTGASFYVDWALLEGKPGNFSAQGVFDLKPFFEAAATAGIYLLARPGPYINAEVSGGGFPGWLQRVGGKMRTPDSRYMNATDLYTKEIGRIIADAQITNGGPVIIFQPENEYSPWADSNTRFPDPDYMNAVFKQFREAGIVVPFVSNDAGNNGLNVPGDEAPVDIYGHDGYPLGFDCANPHYWNPRSLPTDWRKVHLDQSPNTPYAVPEFQGGSFDPWGGTGMEKCVTMTGPEFERVFYKNMISFGINIFNLYMTFGGTNWGNLGHPHGYTSYDYGAIISEERLIDREKYSEAKLIATFIESSPGYLDAEAAPVPINGLYTDTNDIVVTELKNNDSLYLILRHDQFYTDESKKFKMHLPLNSEKTIEVPHSNNHLILHGRDSKIFVVNYFVGNFKIAYSTAEIFTWKSYSTKTVLVVYADDEDYNEIAFYGKFDHSKLPSSVNITTSIDDELTIFSWTQSEDVSILQLGSLYITRASRRQAYDFWVLSIPSEDSLSTPYTGNSENYAIIKGGYLMRTARILEGNLFLTGDINKTTSIEVLGGAPTKLKRLYFNGKSVSFEQVQGTVFATLSYKKSNFTIPDLTNASWNSIDALPEISPSYDDSLWIAADLKKTYNDRHPLLTPTSLYASDYGYHWGYVLYRGSFIATGKESSFYLHSRGGLAFGVSVWINGTFLDSYTGDGEIETAKQTIKIPELEKDATYIFTILIDSMGHNQNWNIGVDESKLPIGILNYHFKSRPKNAISWKITGNLHGEDYEDRARGPANEGGLWPERHGLHLPQAAVSTKSHSRSTHNTLNTTITTTTTTNYTWTSSIGPSEGLPRAGARLYTTNFTLAVPAGHDVPLALQVGHSSDPLLGAGERPAWRLQLWVNGWQFGKFVNNIGPQTRFPVPEGIWNYRGENWVAVSVWSLEAGPVEVLPIKLVGGVDVMTGRKEVDLVESPVWTQRAGAY